MNTAKRLYLGRSHVEAIRRQLTELEFELMGDGVEDTQNFVPNAANCRKWLGNVFAQADALQIIIEDLDRKP